MAGSSAYKGRTRPRPVTTSMPSIQALVFFPSILLMIFFTFFLYTWCNDDAYTLWRFDLV